MNLTDLKSIWTEVSESDKVIYSVANEDMQKMISKKSHVLLSKIVRELKIKRWLVGSMGIAAVFLSIVYLLDLENNYILDEVFSRTEMVIFIMLLGLLMLILFVNIVQSYRRMMMLQRSATDLKTALETSVLLLRRIQKLAIFSDTFAIPLITASFTYRKMFAEEPVVFDERILYVILSAVISFALVYMLSRTVQQKKFGKYIDQLRHHLMDLKVLDKKKNQ